MEQAQTETRDTDTDSCSDSNAFTVTDDAVARSFYDSLRSDLGAEGGGGAGGGGGGGGGLVAQYLSLSQLAVLLNGEKAVNRPVSR
jgi:hypothetical protein